MMNALAQAPELTQSFNPGIRPIATEGIQVGQIRGAKQFVVRVAPHEASFIRREDAILYAQSLATMREKMVIQQVLSVIL